MREKKKYNKWIGDNKYRASRIGPISLDDAAPPHLEKPIGRTPPNEIHLPAGNPAFFLGLASGPGSGSYVGIPQGTEGNIMVVGGNGCGKSSGIAMPTLQTWSGTICATDVKGELSDFYGKLYRQGLAARPFIVLDPKQIDGPSFDPFGWPEQDDEVNLDNNIWDIVRAIIPKLPNDNQPFWAETEQGVFAAALLHYFKCGLSFSETVIQIMNEPISILCKKLMESDDVRVQIFLGEAAAMKPETLANVDRGLRNKLMLFASDPYISHAFRGRREGANCFTWEDLNTHNIFLRIPADKIEQWSGAVNLMYTQLIRHLERRPEMHSSEGASNVRTLLLMDEFARFGKLEMITAAMATLRSKNVNICLIIQSIAQLDKIYGEYDRRIIFDNCQYQAILRANDADTQKYLAELIGTHIGHQRSISEHMDEDLDTTGYSRQVSESREWIVQPHELSTLNDVLLLTPYGFCRVEKFRIYDEKMKSILLPTSNAVCMEGFSVAPSEDVEFSVTPGVITRPAEISQNISIKNEGAKMLTIEERSANANDCVIAAEHQQRQKEQRERDAQERKNRHRNYIVGELVSKYFPEVLTLEPATRDENIARFEPLEAFLYVLSTDYDLVKDLQDRAAQLVQEMPDGEWRLSV